jgi:hypothetical protein
MNMNKTMLQPVEGADLVAVEGGASLDLTSLFSKVKVRVTETHTATAKIFDNRLGEGAQINVAQQVS